MAQARQKSSLSSQPHRILVVGGSYGGLSCIGNLLDLADGKPARLGLCPAPEYAGRKPQRGVEITLLDERNGFFHTVGAPLAHTTEKHVTPFWKEYSALKELRHPALKIARGRIESIDCEARTAKYTVHGTEESQSHEYDHLVVATGLSRQWPIVPASHHKDLYVAEALQHISTLTSSKRTVVIGGGAVGIEVAAELKHNNPELNVTLVHSRDHLLSNEPLPDEFKDRALQVIKEEGVEVVLGQRATVHEGKDESTKRVELANGTIIKAGAVINATAHCPPNTQFLPSDTLDAAKYVKVTPNLNFSADLPNRTSHFAIGDIVAWTGIKRSGGAMYMGVTASCNIFSNILNSEDGSSAYEQLEHPEAKPMMALGVGGQAILYRPGTEVSHGKQTMIDCFGHDLGWTTSLRFMRLTEDAPEAVHANA